MKIENVLVLDRFDLMGEYADLPIEQITRFQFKLLSQKMYNMWDYIIFRDDNLKEKVLKQRGQFLTHFFMIFYFTVFFKKFFIQHLLINLDKIFFYSLFILFK